MRTSTRQTNDAFAVFVVGAAIGAGLALLLAPEAGSESRHRLGRWLHQHHLSGHDALEKIRHILAVRHNGHQRVNGHANVERRHRRRFGA